MNPIAVVSGADRGLGLALTAGLLAKDWRVFAGQHLADWPELAQLSTRYTKTLKIVPLDVSSTASVHDAAKTVARHTDRVDLLINNAGVNSLSRTRKIDEAQDYDDMHRLYDINALGALRAVEAFVPLLDQGTMRRLCFVSSEAGSIGRAARQAWFAYCMSKAALNMGVKILFNDLRPQGYTFRLYHPGGINSYIGGSDVKGTKGGKEPEAAAVPALDYFLGDLSDSDAEDRLVMQDWRGEEWPW
jgi:NAD(P)-dependent dehydrogenase (short-subunit alcohol dehydrogenase family)